MSEEFHDSHQQPGGQPGESEYDLECRYTSYNVANQHVEHIMIA